MSERKLLIVGLFLLCGALPRVAEAQNANAVSAPSFHGAKAVAAPKSEVTITGTIQQVSSSKFHAKSAPAGVNILVAGPQGLFDASLGPWLAAEVKQSLAAGEPVQLTGTYRTVQGQSYLIARQFTVANRQITIRNEQGFPTHKTSQQGHTQKQIHTTGENQ